MGGRSYAFVGLERIGGVMAYDVTNPQAATFAAYANQRKTTVSVPADDLGAERVTFVPEEGTGQSERQAAGDRRQREFSRTVSIFRVDKAKP